MTPGDDLFDDVDEPVDGLEEELPNAGTPDQRTLRADDTVAMLGGSPEDVLRGVWHDLDFRELHAILVGLLPVAIGVAIGSAVLIGASMALAAVALGFCGVGPLRRLCGCESGRTVAAVRWAVREPHYLLGGQLTGLLVGAVLRVVLVAVATATALLSIETALLGGGLVLAGELTRRLYGLYR